MGTIAWLGLRSIPGVKGLINLKPGLALLCNIDLLVVSGEYGNVS